MKLSVGQVSKSHVIEKHHLAQHHQVQCSLKFMMYFLFAAGQQTKRRHRCGFKVNTFISSNEGNRACKVYWGEPSLLQGVCHASSVAGVGNDPMASSVAAVCAGFFQSLFDLCHWICKQAKSRDQTLISFDGALLLSIAKLSQVQMHAQGFIELEVDWVCYRLLIEPGTGWAWDIPAFKWEMPLKREAPDTFNAVNNFHNRNLFWILLHKAK